MTTSSLDPTRRPLSAGELLDRTITILVRRAGIFLAVVAIVILPITIVQIWIPGGTREILDAITRSASQTSPQSSADLLRVLQSAHLTTALVAQYVLLALTLPLAAACVIFAASQAYDGHAVSLRAALAGGVRRWLPSVGVILLWVVGGAVVLALFLLAFVAAGAGLFAVTQGFSRVLASGIMVVIVVIGFVAGAIGSIVLTMVYMLALAAAVIETANPFVATGRAFLRIFTRREFWRAALLALALIVVSLALSLAGLIAGGTAYGFSHLYPTLVVCTQLTSLLGFAFQFTFGALYYRDVRLRREGTDLLEIAAADSQG